MNLDTGIYDTSGCRSPELAWALDVAAAVLPAYEALLSVPYPQQ